MLTHTPGILSLLQPPLQLSRRGRRGGDIDVLIAIYSYAKVRLQMMMNAAAEGDAGDPDETGDRCSDQHCQAESVCQCNSLQASSSGRRWTISAATALTTLPLPQRV